MLFIYPRHCLTHEEAEHILNDCYIGTCGNHLSGMATSQNIIRANYFWPSLFCNCVTVVKHCSNFQIYTSKTREPPTPLHPIITVGPFCKWGIDFMECRPPSNDDHKYIIVAIDYFTKWAEAMPTFNNTVETVVRFFFDHVITCFGVPKQLVSNHGTHFQNDMF